MREIALGDMFLIEKKDVVKGFFDMFSTFFKIPLWARFGNQTKIIKIITLMTIIIIEK